MRKKFLSVFCLCVTVSLFIIFGVVGINGADIYGSNVIHINEKATLLGELCESYAQTDVSDDKSAAVGTGAVIIRYQNAINALRGDARIAFEDLSPEITLLYEKGRTAGGVSFVYWSYADSLGEGESVRDDLELLLSEIDGIGDAERLIERRSELEGKMYLSVFSRKLSLLYTATDSAEVAEIASGALADIERIANGELLEMSYDEVYEKAAADIKLQCQREEVIRRFKVCCDSMANSGAVTDKLMPSFLYEVEEAKCLSELNSALLEYIINAARGVFGNNNGSYAAGLLENILRECERDCTAADADGEIWGPEEIFEGFQRNLFTALAKDELCAYAKDILSGSDYGVIADSISRFDSSESEEEISFELGISKFRVDLLSLFEGYEDRRRLIFDEIDHGDSKKLLNDWRVSYDEALLQCETHEGARDVIRVSRRNAEELLSGFEVLGFMDRFSDLLTRDESTVSSELRGEYRRAIEYWSRLSDAAMLELSDELTTLIRGARIAEKAYVMEFSLGADRKQTALFFCEAIDGVGFSDAESFLLSLSEISVSAEAAFGIHEYYEDIINGENYSRYPNEYKNLLSEKRDHYLRLLLEGEDPDEISFSARLELKRSASYGEISILADDGDSSEVSEIISAGFSALRLADDTDSLEKIVERCRKDVFCGRLYESVGNERANYLERLSELTFLSKARREELSLEIWAQCDSAGEAILCASDITEAQREYSSVTVALDSLLQRAISEDLKLGSEYYSSLAEAVYESVRVQVNSMSYLSGETVEAYLSELFGMTELFRIELGLVDDVSRLGERYSLFESDAYKICEEAHEENLHGAREHFLTLSRSRAEEKRAELSELRYLSAEELEKYILELDSALSVCEDDIFLSTHISRVSEVCEIFLDRCDVMLRDALERELQLMRGNYCESVADSHEAAKSAIRDLEYLSESGVSRYLDSIGELSRETVKKIKAAAGENEALDAFEAFSQKLAEISELAEKEELDSARSIFGDRVLSAAAELRAALLRLEYLTEDDRADFEGRISRWSELALDRLDLSYDTAAILRVTEEYLLEARELRQLAEKQDLSNAKSKVLALLEERCGGYSAEGYTEARYERIKEIYRTAYEKIASSATTDELLPTLEEAYSQMSAVRSIFDDLKKELSDALTEEYKIFEKFSENYGDKSGALFSIYSIAKSRIETAGPSIGESGLRDVYASALHELRALPLYWISCGNFGERSSAYSEYPAGYDTARGLWGSVSGSEGLPFGVTCSMKSIAFSGDSRSSFRKAVREGRIVYSGASAYSIEELRGVIERLEVRGAIELKLIKEKEIFNEFSGEYTVRVLLPKELREVRKVWVAYISSTGETELFECSREGSVLEFTTPHFSEFLILGEKENGIFSFIIILSLVAALLTAGTIVWLIKRRRGAAAAAVELGGELSGAEALSALPVYFDSVSAEEAKELIADSEAEGMLGVSRKNPNVCRGCKKTFVNVDTLSKNYSAGEVVDIQSLKKKGLVPWSACYIKVLARGSIDKPLEVRAQAFSRDAVKMITLTGGSAVVEGTE